MLPNILSLSSLQAVAPAHVSERDRKKTNRQHHEHNVLHERNLRKTAQQISAALRTSPEWTYQ
jgi:hypothetical protein